MKSYNKTQIIILMLIQSAWMHVGAQTNYLASSTSTATKNDTSHEIVTPKESFRFKAASFAEWLAKVPDEDVKNEAFGVEIGKKRLLVNQLYLSKESIAPGEAASKTIFLKPAIYFSTKKIEMYLKKAVKSGTFTYESACNAFNKVLDVVINISNEDTSIFEKRLTAVSTDAESLLNIYLYEVKLDR